MIRDARPDDFDALWRIDQLCFVSGISYTRAELAAYMALKSAFTLLDDEEGAIRGFVVAHRTRRRGHVITIDVLPSAQRAGIGSGLLAAAEQRLRAVRCDSVWLETAVDNPAAIAFYKRQGYSVQGILPRYYLASVDALVMAKRLAA